VVAVLALVVAVGALAFDVVLLRRTAHTRPRSGPSDDSELPTDVHGLRQEVAALRLDSADTLRHVAVVRYDAFGDVGGRLSWSLALLDDRSTGLVNTAIHGRNDARTYAKSILEGSGDQPLSPEEEDALAHASEEKATDEGQQTTRDKGVQDAMTP